MTTVELSDADSRVLSQVFNPESATAQPDILIDADLPTDRRILDPALLTELQGRQRSAILIVEQFEKSGDASRNKEEGYESALHILDLLVADHPSYASARNNRAQLSRWRFGDRHMLIPSNNTPDSGEVSAGYAAFSDLRIAISLASPEQPQGGVAPSQARLLAQVYTQLAAMYYAAAKDVDKASNRAQLAGEFSGWSKDRFEEEASRCFYLGGMYGNEVAKALAVHTNPHAKLCGRIVREAMRKEMAAAF